MTRLPTRRRSVTYGTRGTGGDLRDFVGVRTALQAAQTTMGMIVQDARNFRSQSNSSLETISDRALRESVGLKPRYAAEAPTSVATSDSSSTAGAPQNT